jgi:predicted DNA-binding protein
MSQKDKLLNFRVSEEFSERLNKASEILDIPYSQIVREAVNEKLERLAKRHPELREEAQAA